MAVCEKITGNACKLLPKFPPLQEGPLNLTHVTQNQYKTYELKF